MIRLITYLNHCYQVNNSNIQLNNNNGYNIYPVGLLIELFYNIDNPTQ
jgi:hypothetical protein